MAQNTLFTCTTCFSERVHRGQYLPKRSRGFLRHTLVWSPAVIELQAEAGGAGMNKQSL